MQRLQLTEPPQVPFPTAVEDHDDVPLPFLHLNYDSWTLNHLLANFCLRARCVSFYQIVCLSVCLQAPQVYTYLGVLPRPLP